MGNSDFSAFLLPLALLNGGIKGLWKIIDKKCIPKSCTLQQFSNKNLIIDAVKY